MKGDHVEQFKWPCSQEKLDVLFGEVFSPFEIPYYLLRFQFEHSDLNLFIHAAHTL